MKTDLVSVIIPAWNAAAHIADCLESVLNQTHPKLEIIVINDGSDDQTAEIIKSFLGRDSRISCLHTSANSGGPATPRNLGMQHAKGDYLAFLDADDIWHPNKLELQLKAIHEYDLAFVSTEHQEFSGDFDIQITPQLALLDIKQNAHHQLLMKNNVTTSSALVRAPDIQAFRFDERARYIAIEDYVMWLHLHQQINFASAIISNRLVYYRRRSDSLSASRLSMAKKIYRLLEDYEIDGKHLGWRRYFYFSTYLCLAIRNRAMRVFS